MPRIIGLAVIRSAEFEVESRDMGAADARLAVLVSEVLSRTKTVEEGACLLDSNKLGQNGAVVSSLTDTHPIVLL